MHILLSHNGHTLAPNCYNAFKCLHHRHGPKIIDLGQRSSPFQSWYIEYHIRCIINFWLHGHDSLFDEFGSLTVPWSERAKLFQKNIKWQICPRTFNERLFSCSNEWEKILVPILERRFSPRSILKIKCQNQWWWTCYFTLIACNS